MKAYVFSLIFLCLFFSTKLLGETKFGDVTKEELEMTVYPNDTTAGAVVLLKDGYTHFEYDNVRGFKLVYEFKLKVKILNEEGLSYWGNQSIEYYEADYKNKEIIKTLSGTTYNFENGKVVKTKLSKDYIFDEDIENKLKIRKFTFPAAKIGSVIEYKYSLDSDFFYELRDFLFQGSYPVEKVKYEISIPEYWVYNVDMKGFEHIKSSKTPYNVRFYANGDVYTALGEKYEFVGENIPALKGEPYVWNIRDYISKVTFELQSVNFPMSPFKRYNSDWGVIFNDLISNSHFGGNLKKSGLFKAQVTKDDVSIANADSILKMIKTRVKWNEANSLFPSDLKEALKKGLGNSADMNFLLINALSEAGFDAYPVVLSTREHGMLPYTHPSASALNYTITALQLDTLTYYADASDKFGAWNVLPHKCMVNRASLLDKTSSSWVNLSRVCDTKGMISVNFSFVDSKYVGKVKEVMSAGAARAFRNRYDARKNDDDFIEQKAIDLGGNIVDFNVEGLEDTKENINLNYIIEKEAGLGDEFIYINPMIEKVVSENLFKAETRKFPINFDAGMAYTQIVTIDVPEGYEVEELPQSAVIKSENSSLLLSYKIGVREDKILLNYTFRLNQLLFLQTDYDVVKDFFGQLVSKNSEQIVLKKIGG